MAAKPYRSTPVFDEVTLPKALRNDHRTKPGTWGVIRVLCGRLKLTILDPPSESIVTPDRPATILPEQTHFVEPIGAMQMQVDFYDQPPPEREDRYVKADETTHRMVMNRVVRRMSWSDTHLAEIALPKAVMRLTRSLASGLCRSLADDPDIFWGIGDRGPNIKPQAVADRYGAEHLRSLADLDGAKIMPLPTTGPAIARFRINDATILLEAVIDLTDARGIAITGLPVPSGSHSEFEPVFDLSGAPLGCDPSGADTEGITAMPDGTFWVAEEYGPSLLRVDRSGRVLVRWVPEGFGHCFAGATYPIEEILPALAGTRKLNRGFEAVTATPDGRRLVVAFQSPLAHPDREAHEHSQHVRIWELDGTSGGLIAEYVYPLDDPQTFHRDAAAGKVGTDDIKISEIQLTDERSMLVLERISLTTKIYQVALDCHVSAPRSLSDPATRPTLEQMSSTQLREAGIPVLEKTLILSTDDHPEICGDLEGMILLSSKELLLSNDSDFGIEGAQTQFWLIRTASIDTANQSPNHP